MAASSSSLNSVSSIYIHLHLCSPPACTHRTKSCLVLNPRCWENPTRMSTAAAEEIFTSSSPTFGNKSPCDITVLVVGSTGYIGKFVVRELINRGFNVIAIALESSGIHSKKTKEETLAELQGCTVLFSDVTSLDSLDDSLSGLELPVDVVVSCLASLTGGVIDSWLIDDSAPNNSFTVGRRRGAKHFVLLSAFCVQKPLLEFQLAKLKFEAKLDQEAAKDTQFTYSIVRLTVFFRSLGGQVELLKDRKPYFMFGDGELSANLSVSRI